MLVIFYDTVELFDFADGSTGKVDRSTVHGKELDADVFFGTRDPRFIASIFYPGTAWMGSNVYFHDNTTNMDSAPAGWEKRAPSKNRNQANGTGLLLRKRIDEGTINPPGGTDDTDYIVFRLGEIYLNFQFTCALRMSTEASYFPDNSWTPVVCPAVGLWLSDTPFSFGSSTKICA